MATTRYSTTTILGRCEQNQRAESQLHPHFALKVQCESSCPSDLSNEQPAFWTYYYLNLGLKGNFMDLVTVVIFVIICPQQFLRILRYLNSWVERGMYCKNKDSYPRKQHNNQETECLNTESSMLAIRFDCNSHVPLILSTSLLIPIKYNIFVCTLAAMYFLPCMYDLSTADPNVFFSSSFSWIQLFDR